MVLPAYPYFKRLEIEDLSIFNQVFKNNPPVISEFTFTNLYAWRDAYKFQVALWDNFIIIRSDSQKQSRFLNPIGRGNIRTVIENILKNTSGTFIRIPEATKSLFSEDERFKIEEDRDNSDYLFKMQDLITLPGKKYDGKRNLIRKFKSTHSYEYIKLQQTNAPECLKFEEAWCLLKDCAGVEGLNNERHAIREMVKNFSAFDLIGGAIKIEREICALAIGQKLNKDTLVLHILKADPNIIGLYQVIHNEFLKQEGKAFQYVNMEQDLGIEGLRKSKLSYHPVKMIKKYTIALSNA